MTLVPYHSSYLYYKTSRFKHTQKIVLKYSFSQAIIDDAIIGVKKLLIYKKIEMSYCSK